MYNVLVALDRKHGRAFHQAKYVERFAEMGEPVEATVLYVVHPERFKTAGDVEFSAIDSAVEAADLLEAAGVTVNRTVGDGSVSKEIIRTADEHDVDEIVMGGRKRSGVTEVLLGSTVHDVLLSTDRPVTVTGQTSALGEGTRKLLLPVDADTNRTLHQANYVANLPNAAENVEATVLFVFAHQDYEGAPPHEFEEIDAAVKAADRLEEAGIPVERREVGGEVSHKILDAAEELDVDGIVMGGRKRSGIQEVLLGSTVHDIVLSARRPVTLTG